MCLPRRGLPWVERDPRPLSSRCEARRFVPTMAVFARGPVAISRDRACAGVHHLAKLGKPGERLYCVESHVPLLGLERTSECRQCRQEVGTADEW